MKYFKLTIITLILLNIVKMDAQDDFIFENQVWFGLLTNARLSERLSIWNDAHLVPESFLIVRTGATYHFKYNEKLKGTSTLGMAKLWLYSRNNVTPTRKEYRPWGQTTATLTIKKVTLTNRFRYDARFKQDIENNLLQDSYTFNLRLRYFLMAKYPLFKNKEKQTEWYGYAFNEILFDTGKHITNNFRLNQNRTSVGIGYKQKSTAVQLGYLNMFKYPATHTGNNIDAHTATLMVFHNFDFRKNN